MTSPRRKPLSPKALTYILLGGTIVFIGTAEIWSSLTPESQEPHLGLNIFLVGGLLLLLPSALIITIKYWRRLDEAAREAHKWAWYWGGSTGMIPGLFLVTFPPVRTDGWAGRLGFVEPEQLIEFGAMAVLLPMLVGYLIAWGVWWFRKR